MKPTDDARAALKLARQKVSRCRDAIEHGAVTEALGQLKQVELNVEDADAVLSDADEAAHE